MPRVKEEENWAYFQGKIVPESQICLSAHNRGFLYGESAFTTLKLEKGCPLFLSDHLDRLLKSAQFLYPFLQDPQKSQLSQAVKTAISSLSPVLGIEQDFGLRITIFLNNSQRGLSFDNQSIQLLITSFKTKDDNEPRTAWVSDSPKSLNSYRPTFLKSNNYSQATRELYQAQQRGCQEVLFLSSSGYVLEGSTSNIFLVKEEKLATPKLSSELLAGVTRQHLVHCLRENHLDVQEKEISISELLQADEVFLTGSVRGIISLKKIIFQEKIYQRQKYPYTKKFRELFQKYTQRLNRGGDE